MVKGGLNVLLNFVFILNLLHLNAQANTDHQIVEKAIEEALSMKEVSLENAKSYLIDFYTSQAQSITEQLGPIDYTLGEFNLESGDYDSANWYYKRALSKLIAQNDEYYLARTYIGLGYVSSLGSDRQANLDYYLKAEKLLSKTNDTQLLGRVYKRMGDVYQSQKDYLISLDYYKKALGIAEQLSDTLNMVRALNASTTAYDYLKQYDQTEWTLKRAIDLADKINCIRCMAISYSQLGISYFYQNRFKESISMYKLEYELNKKAGLDFDQYFVFQNLSEAYLGLQQYEQALIHSDSAWTILKTENVPTYLNDLFAARYKIFKGLNKPTKALEALELQIVYKDSLFSADKTRILEEMRNTYETEIKEQRIIDLENETKIKELEVISARLWRLVLGISLALLVIVLGVLYYRYILNRAASKAIEERNAILKETNQFKDRMFAIISHDLKSPLSSFSSITGTLNEYYDQIKPEEIRSYMQKLANASRSLEEQMKNLLEWSIKQLNERELHIQPVNLHEIAVNLKDFFNLNLELKNQQLLIDIPMDLELLTDKEYLMTILRNLISNAIKFTPSDGSLWVDVVENHDHILLSVKDSGIGIAHEDFEKLYSLTADKKSIGTSTEKGTGLGLVLVKELTDKLGGKLELQSEEGVGTTFCILLKTNHSSSKAA